MASRRYLGTVYQRANGKQQAKYKIPEDLAVKLPADYPRYVSKTFATKSQAYAWLVEQDHLIHSGKWIHPRDEKERAAQERERRELEIRNAVPLNGYFAEWLKQLETDGGVKSSTIITYRSTYHANIENYLGNMALNAIDKQAVTDWFLTVEASDNAREKAYRLLKEVLTYAVNEGLISENPCQRPPRKKKPTAPLTSAQVASPQQVKALADRMPPKYALSIYLAAWCALRRGEVLALQVKDFHDLDSYRPTLDVNKQVRAKRLRYEPLIGATKTGDVRRLAIPRELVPTIQAHINTYTDGQPDSFIFPGRDKDRPAAGNSLEKQFAKARDAAEMQGFRFHNLRHTGLTFFAMQGATTAEIMARGGHRDVSVAMRYQHAMQERDTELTQKLGASVEKSL